MKKSTALAAAAGLLTLSLASCQKDDISTTIISPVAGDFTGTEACPGPAPAGGSDYQVHIYNQANADNGKVFISNVYGVPGVYEATASGNRITLAPTPYSYRSRGVTYTGNVSADGTVVGSILTLNFKLTGPGGDDCQFVGNRDYRNPPEGN